MLFPCYSYTHSFIYSYIYSYIHSYILIFIHIFILILILVPLLGGGESRLRVAARSRSAHPEECGGREETQTG